VRPISRRVLVRQLAMAIARDGRAQCSGRPRWWSEREAAHAAAVTRRQAELAAAPGDGVVRAVPAGRRLWVAGAA